MWEVWDKKSNINRYSAEEFLSKNNFLQNEETVFLKTENGHVTRVAAKSILAKSFNLDPTLPDDEFIARYEWILEHPDEEIPEGDDTDTTTYAELAQVYAEGVNSIE